MFLGWLVILVTCFLSLGLILFCGCIGFVYKCVCAISVLGLGVILNKLIQNDKSNKKKKKNITKQNSKKSTGRDEQTETTTKKIPGSGNRISVLV
jgi:type III secretory pathway component EscV